MTAPQTSLLAGRAVLVTGAAGFLGRRLVERLTREHGARVTALVRGPRSAARLSGLDLRVERADLANPAKLDALTAGQEIVFNLAYDFKQSETANLAGFANLVEACSRARVSRFLQVSSIAVYDAWPTGDLTEASPCDAPGGPYKNAKREMERRLLMRTADGRLAAVILQPTLVYGPASAQWTDHFAEQLRDGTLMLPGDGSGLCNAVHVDEVVDALILAATQDEVVGETFIISGARPMSWRDLLGCYAQALGRPQALGYFQPGPAAAAANRSGLAALLADPMRLGEWGPARALLGGVRSLLGEGAIEKLRRVVRRLQARGGPLVYYPDDESFALYTAQGRCTVDKARAKLGYAPTADPAAALAQTADYVRRRFGQSGDGDPA